mgnify:CR=1 FL=1
MLRNRLISFILLLVPAGAFAQRFSVSANLADYAASGTINAEASYAASRHFTAFAGAKYNPFSVPYGGYRARNKQRSVYAGSRFWPWYAYSGWWLYASAKWQEFNYGGFKSPATREGDRYGFAAGGGYSYMLNRHLNLEAGAGVYTARETYREYDCPDCGLMTRRGHRFVMLPADVLLGLSYVF